MWEAKTEHDWNLTASLMANNFEVNRDHKRQKQPFTMYDFHPLHVAKKRANRQIISMAELKEFHRTGKLPPPKG